MLQLINKLLFLFGFELKRIEDSPHDFMDGLFIKHSKGLAGKLKVSISSVEFVQIFLNIDVLDGLITSSGYEQYIRQAKRNISRKFGNKLSVEANIILDYLMTYFNIYFLKTQKEYHQRRTMYYASLQKLQNCGA